MSLLAVRFVRESAREGGTPRAESCSPSCSPLWRCQLAKARCLWRYSLCAAWERWRCFDSAFAIGKVWPTLPSQVAKQSVVDDHPREIWIVPLAQLRQRRMW